MPATSNQKLKVALICGGPSLERGISLNSARSVLDHLPKEYVDVHPVYVDYERNFYSISQAQLYSNTTQDFDFKLQVEGRKYSYEELTQFLHSIDLVFPIIHGPFGEDGILQKILEDNNIPFVGSGSNSCARMFYKNSAADILDTHGYNTIPSITIQLGESEIKDKIQYLFDEYQLKRAIVKPVAGGSSIGVHSVYTPEDALRQADELFKTGNYTELLIEAFCEGREFTVVVLQNAKAEPVALIPSGINISYENGGFFDYRRKYLPTANTSWPCPAQFRAKTITTIQQQAENIFKLFNMRDFARLDGWVTKEGDIVFSDFNPISGMEQNSFMFQQASRIGMQHHEVLRHIVTHACKREQIQIPDNNNTQDRKHNKTPVYVLFGGETAERQVSLMSGTNIWLKLIHSTKYTPTPYFLDMEHNIWEIPYTYAFNHTVEEIIENCMQAKYLADSLSTPGAQVRAKLGLSHDYDFYAQVPNKLTLEQFINKAKQNNVFVFLGLHGGSGEDGTIQQLLEQHDLAHNGSSFMGASLCMDKYRTAQVIQGMNDPAIQSAPKYSTRISELASHAAQECHELWSTLIYKFNTDNIIIKPRLDGCSAGIVCLKSADDLQKYCSLLAQNAIQIPAGTFLNQPEVIEMSHASRNHEYIFEPFVVTDCIQVQGDKLYHTKRQGWVELTVGVLEQDGHYKSLNPGITVAENSVLTLEEKFQGGTGINLTPPPEEIISQSQQCKIKSNIENIAKALHIRNYARIDIFFNVNTDKTLVIEANALPALTPSTVIYHQALCENPKLYPLEFLEKIISLKLNRERLYQENIAQAEII